MKISKRYSKRLIQTSLVLFLVLAFFPSDWATSSSNHDGKHPVNLDSVVIFCCFKELHHLSFAWAVFLFSCCILTKIPYKRMLLLLAFLIYPIAYIVSVIYNIAPWTVHGTVQNTQGKNYYFIDSSFLQWQLLALAKLESKSLIHKKYKVLVSTNGDHPRNYLQIVRPSSSTNEYGQLYFSREGWLAGVRRDNLLYLAYDLNSGKGYRRDELKALSPFLLLSEDSQLLESDAKSIIEIGIGNQIGQPSLSTIENAADHPNKEVRSLTKQMLSSNNHLDTGS